LDPWGVIQTPNPLLGCGLLAISSVIWPDLDPQGVIQGSDPVVGCGFWAISSVIWPDMDPQGVIQGSKRGQNGSFWGSQNDPSDRWFWPFSPPKPGQEGSQKGSKKGVKTTPFDPSGTPQTPFKGAEILLLAISSVILAPRGPGGVIQGSKRGHSGTPPERSWPGLTYQEQ